MFFLLRLRRLKGVKKQLTNILPVYKVHKIKKQLATIRKIKILIRLAVCDRQREDVKRHHLCFLFWVGRSWSEPNTVNRYQHRIQQMGFEPRITQGNQRPSDSHILTPTHPTPKIIPFFGVYKSWLSVNLTNRSFVFREERVCGTAVVTGFCFLGSCWCDLDLFLLLLWTQADLMAFESHCQLLITGCFYLKQECKFYLSAGECTHVAPFFNVEHPGSKSWQL